MDELRLTWPGRDETVAAASRLQTEPAGFRVAEKHPADHGTILPSPVFMPANRLYEADNLQVMAALRAELAGRFQLLYADPPFATGTDFVGRTWIGGQVGGGERIPPRAIAQPVAYGDRWEGGIAGYLDAMYPRLSLMHQLLADDGSLYLHVDHRAAHYLKILLDEIFGRENFQREIIWRIGWVSGFKTRAHNWVRNHDTILFYSKTSRFKFRRQLVERPAGYRRRGAENSKASPGVPVEDVWTDLPSIQIMSYSAEKSGYPTQKNQNLLSRIIQAATDPGDLVGDFFCGSGTTLVAAERLGRSWVGADSGRLAIHTARKRLRDLDGVKPFVLCRPIRSGEGEGSVSEADHEQDPGCWPGVQACRDSEGFHLVVSGRPDQLDLLDYWAVDYGPAGEGFTASWESHRTRRRQQLQLASPSAPVGVGEPVSVQLVDISGREVFRTIRG